MLIRRIDERLGTEQTSKKGFLGGEEGAEALAAQMRADGNG